eukprot:scaffold47759_cov16-Tisochrysis_lutea.AAC.1
MGFKCLRKFLRGSTSASAQGKRDHKCAGEALQALKLAACLKVLTAWLWSRYVLVVDRTWVNSQEASSELSQIPVCEHASPSSSSKDALDTLPAV